MNEQQMLPVGNDRRQKWFNSPIRFYVGILPDIIQYVPDFGRQNFALANTSGPTPNINPRLDMIVRRPFRKDNAYIPIGIVSKDYVLVKHVEVIQKATEALKQSHIKPEKIQADLTITEYGERMALSLYLPEEYTFNPGDGNKMAMRLEIFNSVEGSTRFRAMMGWFRFVCSNGLVLGVTQTNIHHRHIGDLTLDDLGMVLTSGIERAETEKENFRKWRQEPICEKALVPWIEKNLKSQWGFKAATRAYHIARTGYDVEIVGQYRDQTPTSIETKQIYRVPGCPTQCKTLYDLSQILAWLAKERRDIQEQLEWREQISAILDRLK